MSSPTRAQIKETSSSRAYLSQISFDAGAITISQVSTASSVLMSVGFPCEITSKILDHTEYWCKQIYTNTISVYMYTVSFMDWNENSCLYLQTGPLGVDEDFDDLRLIKPQKVIFKITSSDETSHGLREESSYFNSRSWFDASIFREDESWIGKHRRDPIKMIPKVSHTRNFGQERIFGKPSYRKEDGVLVYWRNDPETLRSWLCREEPHKLVGDFRLVMNGHRIM
jgi:hypothetical protein